MTKIVIGRAARRVFKAGDLIQWRGASLPVIGPRVAEKAAKTDAVVTKLVKPSGSLGET